MSDAPADPSHYRKLERMYHEAPITRAQGMRLRVADGTAAVSLQVRDDHLHAADGLHGSLCFRVLDDAAFFAANSRVQDVIVLTASFNIEFLRPVTRGTVTARGEIVDEVGRRFLCRAEAHADDGSRVAWGSGTFVRSRIPLGPDLGYS